MDFPGSPVVRALHFYCRGGWMVGEERGKRKKKILLESEYEIRALKIQHLVLGR